MPPLMLTMVGLLDWRVVLMWLHALRLVVIFSLVLVAIWVRRWQTG